MTLSVKGITVRFHLNHPAEKQAWEKLNALRNERHQSFSQIVTDAVKAYESEGQHLSRAEKTEIVHEVTESVSLRLQQILPAFLAGYTVGVGSSVAANPLHVSNESQQSVSVIKNLDEDDAAPDFGDSCMDFDFIGG